MRRLRMLFFLIYVVAGLALYTTVWAQQQEGKISGSTVRVGTFDSRALALAYYRSAEVMQSHQDQKAGLSGVVAAGGAADAVGQAGYDQPEDGGHHHGDPAVRGHRGGKDHSAQNDLDRLHDLIASGIERGHFVHRQLDNGQSEEEGNDPGSFEEGEGGALEDRSAGKLQT